MGSQIQTKPVISLIKFCVREWNQTQNRIAHNWILNVKIEKTLIFVMNYLCFKFLKLHALRTIIFLSVNLLP